MAKQVKVFDVTIGATSTVVYTVPEGRMAKVILSKYSRHRDTSSTSKDNSSLLVIGKTVMPNGVYPLGPVPSSNASIGGLTYQLTTTTSSSTFGGTTSTSFTLSGQNSAQREHFLSAGATVVMFNADAQFCVIEEF